jgi:hypothetical protein
LEKQLELSNTLAGFCKLHQPRLITHGVERMPISLREKVDANRVDKNMCMSITSMLIISAIVCR